MSWLRGVGARLSLALALVVAGALALVYLILVPSLRHRLESARVSQLQRNDSPRARIPWHSETTRFRFVVKVSSLIWIIFTGARATARSSASST